VKILTLIATIFLSINSKAIAQDSNWLHLAITSSVIAQGADLSTTSWAAGKLGDKFEEANPILRLFANDPLKLAVVKISVATALTWYLLREHKNHPKAVFIIALAQTVVIGYVAYRNAQLVRQK